MCLESAEDGLVWECFFGLIVNDVASKENHVALLVVDEFDDGFHILFVTIVEGAQMDVGEEGNAVAVECVGKVAEVEHLLVDHESASPFEIAIAEDDECAERKSHGKDAEVTSGSWLVAVDEDGDAIKDGKYHLRNSNDKEDENETPHSRLVSGPHVVRAIDDEEIDEKENAWQEEKQQRGMMNERRGMAKALPGECCLQIERQFSCLWCVGYGIHSLLNPMTEVHEINVRVGEDE